MPLLPFGPDGVRGRTSLGTWDNRNIRRGERLDNNRPRRKAAAYGFFVVTFGTFTVVVSFFTPTTGTVVVMVSVVVVT
jgi:hypothetical protein